jgi:hypothetical protein
VKGGAEGVYDPIIETRFGKPREDGPLPSTLPKATPHPSNNTELLETPMARSITECLEQ